MSDTVPTPGGHPPTIYNFRPLSDRPGYAPVTRIFTDSQQPGWWAKLILAPSYGDRRVMLYRVAHDLIEKYVTGKVDEQGDLVLNDEKQPVQRPTPVMTRWGPVAVDEWFCNFYAKLTSMWAGETLAPPLEEVIGWQKGTDTAWLEIVAFVGEVEEQPLQVAERAAKGVEKQLGNSPGGTTSTGSADPSATTTNISKSPIEKTPSSLPSNEDNGSALVSSPPLFNPYGPGVLVNYAFADAAPERPVPETIPTPEPEPVGV